MIDRKIRGYFWLNHFEEAANLKIVDLELLWQVNKMATTILFSIHLCPFPHSGTHVKVRSDKGKERGEEKSTCCK